MKTIITIDGPKGSGKSSLAKFIAKKLNTDVFYFGPERSYHNRQTQKDLVTAMLCTNGKVFERGPLSDLVYLTTRGATPTFSVDVVAGDLDVNYNWLPVTINDLSRFYNEANINIVLYASDIEKLHKNLTSRASRSGKYLNEEELKYLEVENKLYKDYFESVLMLNKDLKSKCFLFNISEQSYKEIYDTMEELLRRIK